MEEILLRMRFVRTCGGCQNQLTTVPSRSLKTHYTFPHHTFATTLTKTQYISSQTISIYHLHQSIQDMGSFEMNDRKKIGLGLTGSGIFFTFLGILFLFDKGFLAIGNILFLSGVLLTIGFKSSVQFFMKPKNYKGTISFGLGFLLVLIGWPIFGMILETYGFIVLFSGFWPTLAVFLQRIPVFGWVFHQPFVTSFLDRYRGRRVPV